MTTKLIDLNLLQEFTNRLPTFKRYGFIIDQNDSNPDTCVRYIYDAYGMTPAGLDSSNVFQYGSWKNFCDDINYPCMVDADGKELYRLDPDNQQKRIDGANAPYNDLTQSANMMAAFRKMYVSVTQVEDETKNEIKVVFCDAKLDETYQAYAFTNDKGQIADVFYHSMFLGTLDSNNKIRSLATGKAKVNLSGVTQREYCQANGSKWDFPTYAQRVYIGLLHILISKSLDCKTKFGKGRISGSEGESYNANCGTKVSTGRFSGTVANETTVVKSFYIENLWGESWVWHNGFNCKTSQTWVKLYPPFTSQSNIGYKKGVTYPADGYIRAMRVVDGLVMPVNSSGASTTYWCSRVYGYNSSSNLRSALFGGRRGDGAGCSLWFSSVTYALSYSRWDFACRLALGP